MTETETSCLPAAPEMSREDPAMFAGLTTGEIEILRAHLTSGWYKQSAVYPCLSEPWRDTAAMLDDLALAHRAAFEARREPEAAA